MGRHSGSTNELSTRTGSGPSFSFSSLLLSRAAMTLAGRKGPLRPSPPQPLPAMAEADGVGKGEGKDKTEEGVGTPTDSEAGVVRVDRRLNLFLRMSPSLLTRLVCDTAVCTPSSCRKRKQCQREKDREKTRDNSESGCPRITHETQGSTFWGAHTSFFRLSFMPCSNAHSCFKISTL